MHSTLLPVLEAYGSTFTSLYPTSLSCACLIDKHLSGHVQLQLGCLAGVSQGYTCLSRTLLLILSDLPLVLRSLRIDFSLQFISLPPNGDHRTYVTHICCPVECSMRNIPSLYVRFSCSEKPHQHLLSPFILSVMLWVIVHHSPCPKPKPRLRPITTLSSPPLLPSKHHLPLPHSPHLQTSTIISPHRNPPSPSQAPTI